MREWLAQRNARERLILVAGVVVAVIIVLWGLIWRPATLGAAELREAVAEKAQFLAGLERAEAIEPPAGGVRSAGPTEQSLIALVESTAQALGLSGTFTRTRPDGIDAISVSFSNADFGALLEWLMTLERTHGVSVESASATGARDPGFVNGQVFLRRR